jgi:hypothetical protein
LRVSEAIQETAGRPDDSWIAASGFGLLVMMFGAVDCTPSRRAAALLGIRAPHKRATPHSAAMLASLAIVFKLRAVPSRAAGITSLERPIPSG